ncbi:MAG: multicomponent Na+:H+ antiporter subunit G [Acidimicrobiales bacterium]|jgi:multicomponent Na+:H+ antiporter subunit G
MTTVAGIIMVVGALIAVLAAVGLHKFSTPYARFHAAGKASPVAFLVAALGAAITLGWAGAALLAVASAAMILTLPVGVHLMFRAVHRTTPPTLEIDDLAIAEQLARGQSH